MLTGYNLNEYKIVIPLPEHLEHKIHKLRLAFGEAFQYRPDPSRPHLTLAMFSQIEMMEERLMQKLRTIGMAASPFKLEMKDFGSFPSHTIFIHVTTKEPVRELVRSLREIQRMMRIDADHKPYFLSEPVISIARKLKPWQFEKGWLEYAHRQFTGRCVAESLLLLKRKGPSMPWQIIQRVELQALPVATVQQELF